LPKQQQQQNSHFQITNALLMRVSNTTSTAVTALFVCAFVMISVFTVQLQAMAQQNALDEEELISTFLLWVVAWFVTILPAVLLCG